MKRGHWAVIGLTVLAIVGPAVAYYLGRIAPEKEATELQSDLRETELARQSLNDDLWDSRQRAEDLEEELGQVYRRQDEVTSDRERIREEYDSTRKATLEFLLSLNDLQEREYLTLCQQWTDKALTITDITKLTSPSQDQKTYFSVLLDEVCVNAYY
jgi:chromosome segregation ATPase